MSIKASILTVSILLMIVVVILAAAGLQWSLQATPANQGGAVAVLVLSGGASLVCLLRLWMTRKDHLR